MKLLGYRKGKAGLRFAAVAVATLAGLSIAPAAQAQGSRKDDIVLDAQGRPMGGATVRVCTSAATGQPCTPLASVYSDVALTVPQANPFTTDGLGNYSFYAVPGRYEIEISGPSIITRQFPNVILACVPTVNCGGNGTPGGALTQVQFYDTGAVFNGDAGLTYNSTAKLVGGQGGVLVQGTDLAAFGAVTITPSTTGSTSYTYEVQARRGILSTTYNDATITNGFATVDGSHTNTVSWAAVPGATSYDVFDETLYAAAPRIRGFIGNTTGTNLVDNGSAVIGLNGNSQLDSDISQGGYLGAPLGIAVGAPGSVFGVLRSYMPAAISSNVITGMQSGECCTGILSQVASSGMNDWPRAGAFYVTQSAPNTSISQTAAVWANAIAQNPTGEITIPVTGVVGESILANGTGATVDKLYGGYFDNPMFGDDSATPSYHSGTVNSSANIVAGGPFFIQSATPPTHVGEQIGLLVGSQAPSPGAVSLFGATYGIKILDQTNSGTDPGAYAIYSAGGKNYLAGSLAVGGAITGVVANSFAGLTDASPIAWNATAGNTNTSVTLAHTLATRALNVTNLVNGGNYVLTIVQDSTGGAALTPGTGCTWLLKGGTGSGSFPLSSAANARDTLAFTYDGTRCLATLGTGYAAP